MTTEPTDLFDGSPKPIKKHNCVGLKQRLKLFTRTLIVYIFTPKLGSGHISEGGGETASKKTQVKKYKHKSY
jgi:hypothetical protein